MQVRETPPFAPVLMESTRAIGYSLEAAIADIIDNSVAAKAGKVQLSFFPVGDAYVSILDNGTGMDDAQMNIAMQYGSKSPTETRDSSDLGRYGLGLKTASLSQCRVLTVISKQGDQVIGRRWDLDYVIKTGAWSLLILDKEDFVSVPHISDLYEQDSGTLVVWQNLDRLLMGEVDYEKSLGRKMDEVRQHLELVFHRYLSGESGIKKLEILFNGVKLKAADPFLIKKSTQAMDTETLVIRGKRILVTPYILPHISKMTEEEKNQLGGKDGIRKRQGFYVYRNKRLLIWGTWFRMMRYSTMVAQFQEEEYQRLDEQLPEILKKLKTGIFVWDKHFLGYSNDLETEQFFNRHALLDAQQSVAWDMFPPDCKFGLSYYGDIVHTIVDFAGYAIKHIYCAHLLMQEHQELVIENLLNVFFVKQDLIQLIGKNCSISDETALSILRIASLSPDTMGYYANGNARSAPFIQISEHQYLRTIKGLLDEPFDFILYNIRNFFPEAWDKNVNQREAVFRTQLYTVFDDPRFSCVQHPVIIKEKNKTLTDIDAVVIDKKTGEIALFQLKWQDPADYSPFTLKSKRSNYYSAAEKWLEIIEKWLSNSADEDIASKLGVKVKYFDKKKISIFVLGRRRGNYSGNGPYPYECAWSQWYQIMYAASYLRQENEFTISNLYKLIVSTSPFNIKISEKPVTFCYGKYRIKFGGKTFCGKDTR